MTENERDTHFADFAKLLWAEIGLQLTALDFERATRSDARKMDTIIQTLIAGRAYDLVYHACSKLGNAEYALRYWPGEQVIDEYVPDLTAWPDTTPREIPDEPRHWPPPIE